MEGKDDGCDDADDQQQNGSDGEKSPAGGEVHLRWASSYQQDEGERRVRLCGGSGREKKVQPLHLQLHQAAMPDSHLIWNVINISRD